MSRKSLNLDSSKALKRIRKDLMSFAQDEILIAKNSHKLVNIIKYEDNEHKVQHSKYSSSSQKEKEKEKEKENENENEKNEQIESPNIEIIEDVDANEKEDDACSSELSDEDN